MRHQNKLKNQSAFTLIEVVIYLSIFSLFAVSVIESMIWLNSRVSFWDRVMETRNHNVYKTYFSNVYKRYGMRNPKIENQFSELISSSSIQYPTILEDKSCGIILNQNREGQIFFNSIDNGV